MIFGIKGEGLSPFASLLAEGRILAAGENLRGLEKLYFPILKMVAEKLGGERLELYFNEEKISEIEVAALSDIHGALGDSLVPLRKEVTSSEKLLLVDSCMPELLAAMQEEHRLTGERRAEILLQAVAEKNPLSFPRSDFYKHKWKQYLLAAFGGDAGGGYAKVSRQGERLDFYIYDREHFAEYLAHHTFFSVDASLKLLCYSGPTSVDP